MASRRTLVLLFLISLLLLPPSLQARKLLDFIESIESQHSSSPSKAEQSSVADTDTSKLLSRRKLMASYGEISNERILGSVPSPGVGN
ncbi:hypothetical protein MA16_Dca023293 [Dendrobium catenatum]|uniref:Uncharacterized protein n=1 Tax=Dendrobium catenatum TaxID=906689 RepID=A0A2I0X623_9ASPA|nr:hypothetical protein MA16_Dca023293 [Dendrobium catenatum]